MANDCNNSISERTIGVIDAGLGNTGSVMRMIEKAGGLGTRLVRPEDLMSVRKIILPGVGHFDSGMRLLNQSGFSSALLDFVTQEKVVLLGICLGMQLLFDGSEEGQLRGLGLMSGEVRRIRPNPEMLKVPHMGWNELDVIRENVLVARREADGRHPCFYFVHSYHAVCRDAEDVIATTQYGGTITASVQRGNVFGMQFHPEKSHRFGLALLRRYVELRTC
ncbi:imidazole glycerol phosphate synthase subunit HisH [Shinella sp. H4-D48]|uniref:imidazole glycerol phosphate synthase subunit HisH n=1 Tax=Shinella sp. H4-D48 TaxID=2925841 RepID=UPI001F53426B|nr:imidazole glycerol phosphate synthase subunit HisH [Shinella sp. H4-D48]UNK38235.1 imidazole glycerol phosphate synthase subunit HisH [Shinella sp. H4-D48]